MSYRLWFYSCGYLAERGSERESERRQGGKAAQRKQVGRLEARSLQKLRTSISLNHRVC